MARNRQRSKQRQAERRARRLEQQGGTPPPEPRAGIPGVDADVPPDLGGPAVDPELAAGAPPEEEGRSDFALRDEPSLDDDREPPATDREPPATEEEAIEEIVDFII